MTQGRASRTTMLRLSPVLVVIGLAGCGPVIMLNKMLFGDPTVDCPFKQATKVDLTEGKHKVIVVCTAPAAIRDGDMTGMGYTLLDDLSVQLRREGVKVVNTNEVRTWMDDNGGVLGDPRILATAFDVDFIIHVDLNQVSFCEDNSPDLHRGQAVGEVVAYQVFNEDGEKIARHVFSSSFASTYPTLNPIPASQVDSARIFQKRFIQRVGIQVGHLLHDHRASEEVY